MMDDDDDHDALNLMYYRAMYVFFLILHMAMASIEIRFRFL